jgi:hypothetical protein
LGLNQKLWDLSRPFPRRDARLGAADNGAWLAAVAAMPSLPKARNLLVNLGLVCGTLAGGFFGAEYLLRNKVRFYPVQMGWVGQFPNRYSANFVADAQTGWRMRPNHSFFWKLDGRTYAYTSNSQGFRAGEEFDARDRRFKMAFVGDSFTFGTGVAQDGSYPALLGGDAAGRVSWNFAMPGFGVDQVWLSARDQALPLKPDLLVVGLINADFERSQVVFRRLEGFAKPSFRLVQGRLTQRTLESPPNFLMHYLDEKSRVWSMWIGAVRSAGLNYGLGEYWTLNQAMIDAIREDAKRAGVPVLFLYIPIKGLHPFPALRNYMSRTGANYIDLTAQRPRPPVSIYLPHDSHLSAEGHRYVADLVEQWLQSHAPATVQAHSDRFDGRSASRANP